MISSVLTDFDFAVDSNEELEISKHRVGTRLFMAMDFHYAEIMSHPLPPPHLYWHDLELFIFIYVFLIVALNFELRRGANNIDINLVPKNSVTFSELAEHELVAKKILWLSRFQLLSPSEGFEGIWSCVVSLLADIGKAVVAPPDGDDATLGGKFTYERVAAAFGKYEPL